MSEAPSDQLIEKRAELTEALDKASDTFRKYRAAMNEAKDAVLAFDAKHPEVMEYLNFVVGEAKKEKPEDDE